jgi:release factor glutamine methyltransferase
MKTLGDVLNLSIQYLQDRKIVRPRRQAEDLLSQLLKLQRIELYMQFDRPLEEKELVVFREWLSRRGKGEPLDYIFREINFFNCLLDVDPSVLIPRQETEILLDKVCGILQPMDLNGKIAWDICCGSGCIGIGIKKKLPDLEVSVADISSAALAVAKRNIERNDLVINVIQGDLLEPFKGSKADFIFCNPPYISEDEYAALDHEVRAFEPKTALVGGPTGLEFYSRLANTLPDYLNPRGRVFFEIGHTQGQKVISLFSAACWKAKAIEKDWAGRDRFFFLEME